MQNTWKMKRRISLLLVIMLLGVLSQSVYGQNKTDEKGRKQGYWSKVDKKGNKIYEGNFKDNYEIGTFTYFYEDGKTIKAQTEFSENGKKGKTKMFGKDTKLISEGFYLNKKKDSLWLFYDTQGHKIAEERYVNGMRNGEFNYWDKDKVLIETINYYKDKRNGIYYKNTYIRGYFYYTYKDDKRNGLYEDFYYFQKIKIKGDYKDDKPVGNWKYFDSIGNCVKTQTWQNGNMLNEKIRVDFGRSDRYIETKDIAYFYQTGKRMKIVLFNSEEISCINNIDEFLDVLGIDNILQLNKKLMVYANLNAIKGIGEKVGENYIILLEPKPKTPIFTDKESIKALQSLFNKE